MKVISLPVQLDSSRCDKAIRASFLHFNDDPDKSLDSWEYIEDGLLILKLGHVTALGKADDWFDFLPDGVVFHDFTGKLIMPGFIDTHTHYPQTDMIASHGAQLLEWLEKYTFPTEAKFSDINVANATAEFFCDELLRNGTTTSAVFATIHPESVDAIFGAAQKRDMRIISGKVMMDQNAPDFLCDTAETSYEDSAKLIEKWHGNGRALYAVTPRFVPTSSVDQLRMANRLRHEYKALYLQTHVAENTDEVAWVAELFPDRRSYLDVYEHYGLVGERSIYAHCIHLDSTDRKLIADRGASMAFCPTSNLFLGSGLFDLDSALFNNIKVGVATDVGGGTSFSILQTLNEAYKVSQMSGQTLTSMKAFYLATLGGAKALSLDHKLGNFELDKEADFVVLDLESTPLMERRMDNSDSIQDKLFALMMLGDDRAVHATFVMGVCRFKEGRSTCQD